MRAPAERSDARGVGELPSSRGGVRVLHVDDEASYAKLVATFLERTEDRISVTSATSAAEGLEMLAERPIDCVVSDHDMPDRDGIEFLEAVREEYPNLPFILFTGKGNEEIAGRAISAGVDDYLQKASGTEQYAILANRVVNYVERARERTQRQRLLAAIETAREGMALVDEDGAFIYVNESYGDLYGIDPAAVVGDQWSMAFPGEGEALLETVIRPALDADGYWEGESPGCRADGSTFVAGRTITATGDGELVCSVRDVTERRERQRALEDTNRQLEAVLDTVSAAIFMKDTEGRYLLMNQNCRDLIGIEAGREVVGKTDYDLMPTEVADQYRADDQQVLEAVETLVVEEPVPTPDGTRTHLTRKSPVLDEDGEPYGICAVSTDITDRKMREEELLAATEQLDAVVSNVPMVLFALDPSGEFTLSEGRGLEQLGLEPGEVVGQSVYDVYGWHDDIVAAAERALDGELVEAVYTVGDTVFDTTFQPVFDGDGTLSRVIGIAVDVTDLDVPDASE